MKMVVRGHYWVAPNDLQKKYGISNNSATIIVHEVHASLKVNAMPVHRFGFRDDTYFTEDYLLNGVKYSPEDLKGEELEIYNSL